MAIPAFLVAAGKGILAGGKWVAAFVTKHAVGLTAAATVGTSMLAGNSFEGKKKKVTIGKSESITAGKYSFRVPQFRVENARAPKDVSSRSNKARDSNYSRKRSNRYS